MSRLRVIVVEDQGPAREHLVDLLGRREDVEVVAVCRDGRSAIDTIRTVPADLVLLDIQMPECDGFQVIAEVGAAMPAVVMVTAYDDHAVRAFDVRALDYLLKPFTRERVDRAIDLAKDGLRQRRLQEAAKAMAALVDREVPDADHDRILVRQRGQRLFIPISGILWVESMGNDVVIHRAEGAVRARSTLSSMHRQLGTAFVQVHRSALVNITATQPVLLVAAGSARLRLSNGREIPVSRACRPEVERRLRAGPVTSS